MSSIKPPTRPEATREAVLAWVPGQRIEEGLLIGRRGYYRDSMGDAGENDIGIYDDAMFFITPTIFKAFNANCDPSRLRPGMATLKPGSYIYKLGIHNISKDPKEHPHYPALVQASAVTVEREGKALDAGWFGINIHKGGYGTTSSEGCQTIYPDQWDEFFSTVEQDLKARDTTRILYILTARENV